MSDPFRSAEEYERFVYTLADNFPAVERSTLTFIRLGASLARVEGEIFFAGDFRIAFRERIQYLSKSVIITRYSYEIWRGAEQLSWYDPQPHPHIASLKKNHPHHKHIPPDIKHNRVPAPEMSFTQPNLPVLIREIEALIEEQTRDEEKKSEQED